MKRLLSIALLLFAMPAWSMHESWVKTEYPQDKEKKWWNDDWWEKGQLPTPVNHEVEITETVYKNGDTEIPALLFRPKSPGKYPGILFQHGRRGIDDLTRLHPLRLAARGFVVLAPDVWSGRFIEKFPIEYDYAVEADVAAGIDFLLTQPGLSADKICTVSHTRGGYMTLKALVTERRQKDKVACYVSYYPHWQDPNAAEAMQVYRYANEVNELEVPVLIFFGEHEQYQRYRPIMQGIEALQNKGRDAEVIIYPGVGRGFDFRPPHVRSFADDLAAKDAMQRTANFVRKHLSGKQ